MRDQLEKVESLESASRSGRPQREANLATLANRILHFQQTAGNASTTDLVSSSSPPQVSVQRYEIEGPWDKNDPVHESITQDALRESGTIGPSTSYSDPSAWEYTRGAMWNDDPEGMLFHNDTQDTHHYSTGATWYRNFRSDEKRSEKGVKFGASDPLLARSHFGDLQFLHGMASRLEKTSTTRDHMMMWAEFTYRVGTGNIASDSKLSSVSVPGFSEYFMKQGDFTVQHLFNADVAGDPKERAVGSLLHMIQDSYASGHVERTDLGDGRKGAIVSFHDYSSQDPKKHDKFDKLPPGKGSDEQRLRRLPGVEDAIAKSAQVIRMVNEGRPWSQAELYLRTEVFDLEPMTRPASGGQDFLRDGAPPEPHVEPTVAPLPGNDAVDDMEQTTAMT